MFAFIFDSVGFGEWFVLLAVVLVVVGPKKLPSTARTLGNYYAKFRRAAESFKRQIMDMETEITREANAVEDAFKSEGDESKAIPAASAALPPPAQGDAPSGAPDWGAVASADEGIPPFPQDAPENAAETAATETAPTSEPQTAPTPSAASAPASAAPVQEGVA